VEALVAAFGRARREHAPQLVTLVGVPGIGKSRLVQELFRAIEDETELISWRQGRSLPYGEGVTYWALAELVKGHAGILETDSAEEAGEKLSQAVSAAVDDPPEALWVEAHLRPLVGLGGQSESSGDRREEAFAAWRRFLEALAEQRPLVLVFEDLHWADDGLLDFVDYLADWASAVPLLLVCTARPELLGRRPGWGGGKPNAATISLAPLSTDETARLVHALLDRAVLPAALQATLLDRAGGNPLYAEEFARMMLERGSLTDGELPLPESLQGVIAARLDVLEPDEKALLHDAAVLGKVFWPGALAALGDRDGREVGGALHALARKQFVRRERRSSVAGETQHAFLHLLVRDVAYGQITRATRAEKHRRSAEWIESIAPDRSEDRAEMLAHHYLAALELAGAAGVDTGALAERARPALREAGDRAVSLNAYSAASRFYEGALDLVPDGDPARPDLLLRLAKARSPQFGQDFAAIEEAVAGFLAQGDVVHAAEGEALLAVASWQGGQRDAADAHLARAVSLVADATSSPAKVRVLAERSRFRMLADDNEAAILLGREVLPMAEELGLDEVRASLLNNIGTCRVGIGDSGGFADLEESLRICLDHGFADAAHRSYHNLMESYRRAGRLADSSRVLADERRSDERYGFDRLLRDWVTGEEAVDRYLRGDWASAIERADAVIADAEGGEVRYMETGVRIMRAAIRFARGDEAGAAEDGVLAVERAREQKDPQVLAPALAGRAVVLVRSGRRDAAAELVDEVPGRSGAVYYSALIDLAWALFDLGRPDELLQRADTQIPSPWSAAALAIASGSAAEAARILAHAGAVSDAAYARLRSADESEVRRALDFYRSVGAARFVREGEALLARTA
jgi:tetratricopeptide (TPR) repeat protein